MVVKKGMTGQVVRSGKTLRSEKSSGSQSTSKKVVSRKGKASKNSSVSDEKLLSYYRQMLMIRRFEERAGQLYGMGLIGGFCHLYIGQEAVVVGLQSSLEEGDQVITSYRDHGHMLACGMTPDGVMAELTGREGGYSKGKGGSMHMFSRENNFFGGHGIVGAQWPIGTGLGFANKYRNNDRVSMAYFGDGAMNQGQVYESFNMAGLWKLPVVYVVENNKYGMGTSVERVSSFVDSLHSRGASFGIEGESVDGMDVEAVATAGEKAVSFCREGRGPYILEMNTYRYRGHSMSDPAKYRSREEVQEIREKRDPIDRCMHSLLDRNISDAKDLKEIDRQIKAKVAQAVEFAQNSPEPDAKELFTDVLV